MKDRFPAPIPCAGPPAAGSAPLAPDVSATTPRSSAPGILGTETAVSSRRKSWGEIAAYYEAAAQQPAMGNWAKLRDFARAIEERPYAHALVSVGSLGGIFVFRDPECVAQRGYFMIECSATNERSDIRFGFFTDQEHDTAKLSAYSDAESAIQAFERGLEEHGFI